MTSQILETYKQRIESMELIPAGGGCFELTLDDELVYSKLATGEFPEPTKMVKLIGDRLA